MKTEEKITCMSAFDPLVPHLGDLMTAKHASKARCSAVAALACLGRLGSTADEQ